MRVTPELLGDLVYFWRHPEVTLALATVVAVLVLVVAWYDRRHPAR